MAPFPLEKASILSTITVHQYNVNERTELSKATFFSHRREPELLTGRFCMPGEWSIPDFKTNLLC